MDEDNRYFVQAAAASRAGWNMRYASPFLARHANGVAVHLHFGPRRVAGGSLIQEILAAAQHRESGTRPLLRPDVRFRMGSDVVREFAPRPVAEVHPMKRLLLLPAGRARGGLRPGRRRPRPARAGPPQSAVARAARRYDQDWACTFAGCDQAPAPPFRFLKSGPHGDHPQNLIKDAKGRQFSVKFGTKVIPECFSSRFVAALGYTVEPSYYVAPGNIEGARIFVAWEISSTGTAVSPAPASNFAIPRTRVSARQRLVAGG